MTKGVDLHRPWCGGVLLNAPRMNLSFMPPASWGLRFIGKVCRIKRRIRHAILRRLGKTWGDPS